MVIELYECETGVGRSTDSPQAPLTLEKHTCEKVGIFRYYF